MMKSLLKIWRYLIATAILVLAGAGVWYLKSSKESLSYEKREVLPTRVADLRAAADLCATEIYREESVVDTVSGKVIFGIWKIKGRILYDLDNLDEALPGPSETRSGTDTVRLRLPKERIELLEAPEADSWRVVDSYSLRLGGSSRLTPEEENQVKREGLARIKRKLYSDGTVKISRKEAALTLERFLTAVAGCPVKVEP